MAHHLISVSMVFFFPRSTHTVMCKVCIHFIFVLRKKREPSGIRRRWGKNIRLHANPMEINLIGMRKECSQWQLSNSMTEKKKETSKWDREKQQINNTNTKHFHYQSSQLADLRFNVKCSTKVSPFGEISCTTHQFIHSRSLASSRSWYSIHLECTQRL